jgi:DNA-binding response OmpR family regulator
METAEQLDRTPRVLVVQPDPRYLAVLARRIGEFGFRAAIAESLSSALAELHRSPVDLVLAELKAPGFNGRELVAMMREDAIFRHIPILLFSGGSDHEEAAAALRSGADGVVKKPFVFEVLCARIAREVERKRAIDELQADNRTLDARVIERAMQIGELREQLAEERAKRVP